MDSATAGSFYKPSDRWLISWQDEHFMKEAIVDAILENPTASRLKFFHGLSEDLVGKIKSNEKKEDPSGHSDGLDFDDDQWDSWGDEDADNDTSKDGTYGDMQLKLELRDIVDNLFKFFHKLSGMKGNSALREGMSALESRRNDDPSSTKGLLHKILTNVLDHNEIPGMEYHSSIVGRLFKSGFGRFGLGQVLIVRSRFGGGLGFGRWDPAGAGFLSQRPAAVTQPALSFQIHRILMVGGRICSRVFFK